MKQSDQKGQAMVELALLLPLLLLIVFGITEFGRAFYIKNALTNAAREGARRASVTSTDPTVDPALTTLRGHVKDACTFPVTPEAIAIESTSTPPQHGVSTITVTVPYDFVFMYPVTSTLNITLTGQASMFYE
ncbi:TadE/TadG family type IV pilus assembly protein [Citrifermentans bremense]|uniref:TadE/TadG family type IV pilus assembly protein n=1 Tax=Citrifermentans bremense TaxID=60035 RepID=UPI000686A407|nr:TadE/TadG family type IV pilus assembly protein [Citrifermentans bremense]